MTGSVASDGPLRAGSPPPMTVYDVALLDLDGVVYVGPAAVPHAVSAIEAAGAAGMASAYVTNNASRPPAEVAAHLTDLGLSVEPTDVVTSAQAGARLLAERVPKGAPVLAVGGPGVSLALAERGLRPVTSAADGPAGVLQGFGPDVGWRLLAEGAYALARGVPWVATNTDLTIPTPWGTAPGNGALVDLLRRHSGREPLVAGKPEPPLVQESVQRTGAGHPLMVGDRLDTDIEGATRAGIDSLLVLTGVTGISDLVAAVPTHRPTLLGRDLRWLLREHPPVLAERGGWRCRRATAEVTADAVVLTVGKHCERVARADAGRLVAAVAASLAAADAVAGSAGVAEPAGAAEPAAGHGDALGPAARDDAALDVIRAAVVACWEHADRGGDPLA